MSTPPSPPLPRPLKVRLAALQRVVELQEAELIKLAVGEEAEEKEKEEEEKGGEEGDPRPPHIPLQAFCYGRSK